ncbi:translation initiation factor IF-2 [Lichenibacterium minor]|uniref:Translation initiation factor IF-2 n=1 Tax=Lichenibacterium minor TaxID=2316528 RepID=A0A4Q2U111_9HYPH|nr:translation initiation factor IF-2 [Lichenibacterium minor]RYC30129.1 translation initiation factor IF-2 [Lichenibacterium minor]
MSEPNNVGEKTLSVTQKATLSLKRPVEQGTVRQSFSHGRTKQVVVEKVKSRVVAPAKPAAAAPAPARPVAPAAPAQAAPSAAPQSPAAPAPVPSAPVQARAPAPAPVSKPAAPAAETPSAAPAAPAPVKAEAPAAPKPVEAPVKAAAPVAPPAAAPAPAPAAPQAAAPAAPAPAAAPQAAAVPAPAAPAPTTPASAVQAPAVQAAAPQPARPAAPAAPAGRPSTGSVPPRGAPVPARPGQPVRPGQPAGRGPAPVGNRSGSGAPASGNRGAPPPAGGRGAPPARPGGNRPQTGVVLRTLTEEEREARARALVGAKSREEDDRRRAEEDAKRRAEREAAAAVERAAAEERQRQEDARRAQEIEAKRRAEEEASRRLPPSAGGAGGPPTASAARPSEGGLQPVIRRPMMNPPARLAVPRPSRSGPQKDRGRLTVSTATSEQDDRTRSLASTRRRNQRMNGHRGQETKEKILREVVLPETITIKELANRMSEGETNVIRMLMKQGHMAKITDVIDADMAQLIAEDLGHTVRRVAESDVEEGLFDEPSSDDDLLQRPPVVTIMGHVDHGKTSLLDAIRQTAVVSGEAGGITQHIGAYQVTSPTGGAITFIDTPGHAAFTAMRARGAKVTDVVILVVAADDGVMPQTIEAINHAKAAGVPIIVAINKIDKPGAKPERVRSELLHYDVQVESMGGDTLEVEVSALQKTNLGKLLEAIELQSEVLDLKADPDRSAEGTVVEARLDRGRGPVATVLVQRGSLKIGNIVVAGSQWGRVRALLDDTGDPVTSAGPSFPVEVLGFGGAPDAGDRVAVVESEARAREITEYRERVRREKAVARGASVRGSLVDMMTKLTSVGKKEFPLLIKGDVQGSVEAILATLDKLGNDEVGARIIHAGVGGITESDITLAEASNAAIIGFNVRAHKEARSMAEQNGQEIRYYNVIYDLVDDVKAAMSGLLPPTLREEMLGNAQILEVFHISKVGKVAGCRVTDGNVQRGANVRLIRDNVVVHEGKLSTLKRFKDEVKDVVAGQECGMAFETYQDMRSGDVIECYRVHEEKRSL